MLLQAAVLFVGLSATSYENSSGMTNRQLQFCLYCTVDGISSAFKNMYKTNKELIIKTIDAATFQLLAFILDYMDT